MIEICRTTQQRNHESGNTSRTLFYPSFCRVTAEQQCIVRSRAEQSWSKVRESPRSLLGSFSPRGQPTVAKGQSPELCGGEKGR